MKNFDLNSMGVQEMNTMEMQETDGGILIALAIAAIVLIAASSCVNGDVNVIVGGSNATIDDCGSHTVQADSTSVNIPLSVPIK